jgi:hypothetical protein
MKSIEIPKIGSGKKIALAKCMHTLYMYCTMYKVNVGFILDPFEMKNTSMQANVSYVLPERLYDCKFIFSC